MTRTADPLEEMKKSMLSFRDERDWKKFHNPKDLAISLNIEAGELLELFLWKDKEDVLKAAEKNKEKISEELADILHNLLLISHDLDIDIVSAFHKKMEKNAKKYPAEKVKGKSLKYNEYE